PHPLGDLLSGGPAAASPGPPEDARPRVRAPREHPGPRGRRPGAATRRRHRAGAGMSGFRPISFAWSGVRWLVLWLLIALIFSGLPALLPTPDVPTVQ